MSPGELIEPGYNGEVSLKSAYKKPLANSLADVERNVVSGESAQITPNEDARLAPNNRSIEVADRQLADNFTGATTDYSVANNSRNVNEDVKYKLNPEHEAQVRAYNEHITRLRQREEYLRGQGMSENAPAMINLRKAQEQAIYARDHIGEVDKLDNVLAYDISGIRKSTGRGLDGSAISADTLDQPIDNSSIPNNHQDINTDNRYQHPLQETINEMEANLKPRMTRELREAIDEFIYENIDPELFLEHSTGIHGNEGGDWNIPRMHVDDLRHHLGKELAGDLPSNYKRRTGKRDIDTVAQEMGYDDIDTFIDEIKRVAEARRAERERKALLAEWRRDPDVIEEAQKMLAERHAEEAKEDIVEAYNSGLSHLEVAKKFYGNTNDDNMQKVIAVIEEAVPSGDDKDPEVEVTDPWIGA